MSTTKIREALVQFGIDTIVAPTKERVALGLAAMAEVEAIEKAVDTTTAILGAVVHRSLADWQDARRLFERIAAQRSGDTITCAPHQGT